MKYMKEYDHKKIENKWQKEWEKKEIYHAKDQKGQNKKPKYYSLIEFPYPSGDGLHVGHPRPYIGMDVISRKRRLQGYNVLYPIGWDAFGLPTENFAIKTGKDPRIVTKKNSDTFRRQIQSLGISFDWSREINTTDPRYYKWTQWIFLQFLKKGLAYKAKMTINWCPKDKIGLANEEVVDGCCERCGTAVEKREKEQWMLAITKYADRLHKDLDDVDYLPQIKLGQRNWIGKSEGAEIDFPVVNPRVKRFLILHGRSSTPKDNFYPWLKMELESKGFKVEVPEMPGRGEPNDIEQADFVEKNCTLNKETVIVGHSMGGLVALRLLERGIKVHGVVFLATPITGRFLDGKVRSSVTAAAVRGFDYEKIKKQADFFKILSDSTDSVVSQEDGKILAKNLGSFYQAFPGNEPHFSGKEEPEVLSYLLPNIKVFTTRPDTIFGATYLVLAPENPYVQSRMGISENKTEIEKYLIETKKKDEITRLNTEKEKTGVELKGLKVINPATNEEIPVWVADYVLAGYGTGAIMAVPGHDERDFQFAKKYDLPIRRVVEPIQIVTEGESAVKNDQSFVKRNAVCAVVRNPKDNTYLCSSWKAFKMNGLITGGVEEGEDMIEAAKREVYEETGYKNLRLVTNPDFAIQNKFYHRVKKQNRWARFQYMFFDLVDESRDQISEEENQIHDIVWVKKEELKNFFTVIEGQFILDLIDNPNYIFLGRGILHHSQKFDDMDSEQAKKEIIKFVGGKEKTIFKLRDWIFSRQRYWGEPIPVINCQKCGLVPVSEKDLPVELPKVKNYQPTDSGESPLANITKWVNVKCPKCKGKAKRETDTMPNWAGSSWYYLRYTDPKNSKAFADNKNLKYWLGNDPRHGGVNWYNGGNEHTTLHLLYSRFWHKFLFDLKLVPTNEPYMKRTSHGLILAEGGEKMSKSKGNVVNPDDIVKRYGADTLRVYEMFMGPFDQAIAWSEEAIIGPRRFLEKVWRIGEKILTSSNFSALRPSLEYKGGTLGQLKIERSLNLINLLHKTIKKVTEDIEGMNFNTAISSMMILSTEMDKAESVTREDFKIFLQILSPFAPHITEELWNMLGEKKSINLSEWPKHDENLIKDEEVKIVVQINGKLRTEIFVKANENEEDVKRKVLKDENVLRHIAGKEIKRVIYVKNRLVNIVI